MRSAIASLTLRFALPLAVAVLAVGSAAAGCNETPLPGTQLGTYKVTGEAKTNTCGAGLGAPDPWVFDALLSQDGTTLYWSYMDGNPPLSGPLASKSAILSTSETANVDGNDAGLGPCTLARADAITVALGSGSPPTSLSGTISYSFTVPSGSTCSDQLTSAGGTYDALPCTLAYTITAARQ
jgi:hypothetical protein